MRIFPTNKHNHRKDVCFYQYIKIVSTLELRRSTILVRGKIPQHICYKTCSYTFFLIFISFENSVMYYILRFANMSIKVRDAYAEWGFVKYETYRT